jgi:hypothetical protein
MVDNGFHQQESSGLATFVRPDFFRYYFLPTEVDERVIVSQRFHVKPLLPLLNDNGRFYILTLSQNNVDLYQADRYQIDQVTVPNLPKSVADALWYDDPERQLQFHPITAQTATHHGHEVSAEHKERLLRFFQQVDKAVVDYLPINPTAPLILASVGYLQPIYEEANSYNGLLAEGLHGNPDELSPTQLQQQGWDVIAPRFAEKKTAAAEQFQALANSERASADLNEVVRAAHFGRVDTLFTSLGQQQWGQFDNQSGEVQLYQTAKPDAIELLEATAAQTLLNGGTVYAVAPEEMPADAPLTAVFRY